MASTSNEVYCDAYNALAAQVSEYTETFNQLVQDRMQNTVSTYERYMMFCCNYNHSGDRCSVCIQRAS